MTSTTSHSTKKKLFWICGLVALVIASGFFWVFVWNLLPNPCGVESVSSTLSPDDSKKVEVFIVNCGATTDWSTQASILDIDEVVSDDSRGNAMRIDGNHGKAWPKVGKGWPIIVPVWKDSNTVEFHYSQDSQVFEQDKQVDEIEVLYTTVTSEFINQNGIEIRETN